MPIMAMLKKDPMVIRQIAVAPLNAIIARKKRGGLIMEHTHTPRGRFEWALHRLRKGHAVRAIHWPEDFFLMLYSGVLPEQRPSIFLYDRNGCRGVWQPSSADLLEDFYVDFDPVKAMEFKARNRLNVVSLKLGDVEIPIDRITEWSKR